MQGCCHICMHMLFTWPFLLQKLVSIVSGVDSLHPVKILHPTKSAIAASAPQKQLHPLHCTPLWMITKQLKYLMIFQTDFFFLHPSYKNCQPADAFAIMIFNKPFDLNCLSARRLSISKVQDFSVISHKDHHMSVWVWEGYSSVLMTQWLLQQMLPLPVPSMKAEILQS